MRLNTCTTLMAAKCVIMRHLETPPVAELAPSDRGGSARSHFALISIAPTKTTHPKTRCYKTISP